jgi:hypothetical protein
MPLSGGRHTLKSTWDALRAGRQTLWLAFERDLEDIRAVAVTCVTRYPAKTMLCIVMLEGRDMPSWESPLHDCFVRYARDLGVDGVELYGRKGWVRIGARYGWKEAATVLDRGLD